MLERGVLRYVKIGGFRVEDTQTRQLVEAFMANPSAIGASGAPFMTTTATSEWAQHFKRGVALMEHNQHTEAAAAFREAHLLVIVANPCHLSPVLDRFHFVHVHQVIQHSDSLIIRLGLMMVQHTI